MEYRENMLCYEDYCELRKSAGWQLFSENQTKDAISNSTYTITAVDHGKTVGMGRLVGDGLYYMIADVVVHSNYQKCGIGTKIMNLLIKHVEETLPVGGRVSIQLIAEKGKEEFYINLGFKPLPNEYCGAGMRKVIRK